MNAGNDLHETIIFELWKAAVTHLHAPIFVCVAVLRNVLSHRIVFSIELRNKLCFFFARFCIYTHSCTLESSLRGQNLNEERYGFVVQLVK